MNHKSGQPITLLFRDVLGNGKTYLCKIYTPKCRASRVSWLETFGILIIFIRPDSLVHVNDSFTIYMFNFSKKICLHALCFIRINMYSTLLFPKFNLVKSSVCYSFKSKSPDDSDRAVNCTCTYICTCTKRHA